MIPTTVNGSVCDEYVVKNIWYSEGNALLSICRAKSCNSRLWNDIFSAEQKLYHRMWQVNF